MPEPHPMPDNLVTVLASKWYAEYARHGSKLSIHDTIAAAAREALEEAEQALKDIGGPRDARLTGMIVAAIAALKMAKPIV